MISAKQILLIILLAQAPLVANATMYAYIDADGKRHFMEINSNNDHLKALATKIKWTPPRKKYNNYSAYSSIKLNSKAVISPGNLDMFVNSAAEAHKVDPLLVKAVIKAESNFDPTAVSPKGAQGLMQLMPGTARDMAVVDAFDPQQNIAGGTKYLGQMISTYNGDIILGLAAYNAGPGRVTQTGMTKYIPETQLYVAKVIDNYRQLRQQNIAQQLGNAQIDNKKSQNN